MNDATTAWEDDHAVPRWAKPRIRRALHRLGRDVARAREQSVTHDDLRHFLDEAGRDFGVALAATERVRPWLGAQHREALHEAAAEVVRRGCAGYRGEVDALVAACWTGIEHVRDW